MEFVAFLCVSCIIVQVGRGTGMSDGHEEGGQASKQVDTRPNVHISANKYECGHNRELDFDFHQFCIECCVMGRYLQDGDRKVEAPYPCSFDSKCDICRDWSEPDRIAYVSNVRSVRDLLEEDLGKK